MIQSSYLELSEADKEAIRAVDRRRTLLVALFSIVWPPTIYFMIPYWQFHPLITLRPLFLMYLLTEILFLLMVARLLLPMPIKKWLRVTTPIMLFALLGITALIIAMWLWALIDIPGTPLLTLMFLPTFVCPSYVAMKTIEGRGGA